MHKRITDVTAERVIDGNRHGSVRLLLPLAAVYLHRRPVVAFRYPSGFHRPVIIDRSPPDVPFGGSDKHINAVSGQADKRSAVQIKGMTEIKSLHDQQLPC
ncbi:hypothetical protein D3C73_1388350 [compost metagenome]